MSDIAKVAALVAVAAHGGQVDKAGNPYINHPARVAGMVRGDDTAEAVAWLHDVIEDTVVTSSDLSQVFPWVVIEAVETLTRQDGEKPEGYYARVSRNRLALRVKLADIADNSDPGRLSLLDEATRERLERKYAKAREALTAGAIRWTA